MVSGPPKPSLTAPLRNAPNRVRSMWDAESVRVSGVPKSLLHFWLKVPCKMLSVSFRALHTIIDQ